MHKFTDKLNLT